MPNLLLTRDCLPEHLSSSVTTHGRPLWVGIRVCAQNTHPLQCGHPINEAIFEGSLHSFGYWLASWYTFHSVCFRLEAGMREGVRLWEEIAFPLGKEGTERIGQDRTRHDTAGQERQT